MESLLHNKKKYMGYNVIDVKTPTIIERKIVIYVLVRYEVYFLFNFFASKQI
jgi:hypothetical protein